METFCTATRQYAKKQMQWFRRDNAFCFVPVDLNCEASVRVGNAANLVVQLCQMSREEYEAELSGDKANFAKGESSIDAIAGLSWRTKQENEAQGKGMKFYTPKRYKLLEGTDVYDAVLKEADDCTSRMQGLEWE